MQPKFWLCVRAHTHTQTHTHVHMLTNTGPLLESSINTIYAETCAMLQNEITPDYKDGKSLQPLKQMVSK